VKHTQLSTELLEMFADYHSSFRTFQRLLDPGSCQSKYGEQIRHTRSLTHFRDSIGNRTTYWLHVSLMCRVSFSYRDERCSLEQIDSQIPWPS